MSRPPTDRYGFPWKRSDPCPCGSGEVFEACCLSADGRPAMAIATLVPPEPKTGEAQANCYMAATCDCGGGLSREHYISRGLIDGPELRVRGMPWQNEEVARYSPDNLVARILCRRHNSALSPLDAHAIRFFLAIEAAIGHTQRRSLSRRPRYFLASGRALELWAMKTLASLYASKIEFRTPEHRFRDYQPPMERIVAELASPAPRSLMALSVPIIPDAHEERVGRRAVSIGPVIEDDRLIGLLMRMHGIAMVFTLDLEDGEELPDKEILRPDMLDLIGVERTSRIYLSQAMRPARAHIVQIRLGRSIRGDRSTRPNRPWDRQSSQKPGPRPSKS